MNCIFPRPKQAEASNSQPKQEPMVDNFSFDERGRFVFQNYAAARPFASFLPGIAGLLGIPMWVFYVNRGQAIASFGIESKDNPILEFQPANKAYQSTPWTGFRTFIKLTRSAQTVLYEPFAPWSADDSSQMFIGMNELEIQTVSATHQLQTNVLYFTLPGENLAGLARQVTITNTGDEPIAFELLDGLPRVIPYGVDNRGLKEISRTLEAWMQVANLEQGVPFYRLRASAADTAEVQDIQAGHFYLAFKSRDERARLLPALVDPDLVFGQNTALSAPDRFARQPLDWLQAQRQITAGKTPCGFFGASATLQPGQALTLYAIIGHAGNIEQVNEQRARLAQPAFLSQKRQEAHQLARSLTDVVDTQTGSPPFDAYCRQSLLDNVLRGGWPILWGDDKPRVYHVYSRKHGDLERDYNAFYVAPEMYSQGNGNYRDVNQNRRCDVWLNPRVGDFNIVSFLGLLQADGYNPLVVNGVRFSVPPEHRAAILALVEPPDRLAPLLAQPFTPGQLLRAVTERDARLKATPEEFVAAALAHAEQHFEARFGEGYWVDHWTYNLDLIEAYLAIYPDKQQELLFGQTRVPFFDSAAIVQPRARKYVLVDGKVRQYGAVIHDAEKAALIAARAERPNLMRTARGYGEVYYTTVLGKLLSLALVKFATLDPLGMGIEMEADKPGWCDALNGLPGLFGSSVAETFELVRLLTFLLEALAASGERAVTLPIEFSELLRQVDQALAAWQASSDPNRDYTYWDAVATAREEFRARVRLGFDGQEASFACSELVPRLSSFRAKAQAGLQHATALNNGLVPTYLAFTVTDYALITDADGALQCDEQGRPYVIAKRFEPMVLPLYLEGPVHALKIQPDAASARRLYAQVKASDLFDRKLNMYRLNASLAGQSHEIGRARAFTPGWLENESIWLHMEYKYLLEVLKAGLHEEFVCDFKHVLVPFLDPVAYGRSHLENSSFIVSSAHPDESLHGAGFVARFTGAAAEFLSMWSVMMAGAKPFFIRDGELCLAFKPVLPGWLFSADRTVSFRFLGNCTVTYHNVERLDTFKAGMQASKIRLLTQDERVIELEGGVIGAPYAAMVRAGQVKIIRVILGMQDHG